MAPKMWQTKKNLTNYGISLALPLHFPLHCQTLHWIGAQIVIQRQLYKLVKMLWE